MAPGYLIAAFCEIAGSLGLIAALFVLRAERRSKASELRGFLRSGQSSVAMPVAAAPVPRRSRVRRQKDMPLAPLSARGPAAEPSAARSALHRAVARR